MTNENMIKFGIHSMIDKSITSLSANQRFEILNEYAKKILRPIMMNNQR